MGICRLAVDKENEQRYTHFVFRIADASKDLSLAIGHKTFYSKRISNVVTKTVIMRKEPAAELLTARNFETNDKAIGDNIRSYFFESERNRLSSPHLAISNDDTFNEWLNQNKYPSKLDKSIEGRYKVYYKVRPDDKIFKEDYLTISKNINGQLSGRYEEWNKEKCLHYWESTFDENVDAHTFSIFMKNAKRENETTLLNLPLFLMLTVPEILETIDTLTGVIAGVRTGNKGAVCRLVLITKCTTDNKYADDYDFNIIEKFFDKFKLNSRVRPPNDDIVCSFSDLKKIVE